MKHVQRKSTHTLVLLTIAAHLMIAGVMTRFQVFYWSRGVSSITGDVGLYLKYANKAFLGEVPYKDFSVEYPIVAIPLFLVPRILASDFKNYQLAFGVEMMLFDVATVLLLANQFKRTRNASSMAVGLGWFTLYFASLCPLALGRYDLAPTAMAFAACCAWSSGRRGLGGSLAGVGTMTKIFPGVSAAPMMIEEICDAKSLRSRGAFSFTMVVVALLAVWFFIGGWGVNDSFHVHGKRGLEIESLYAGWTYILNHTLEAPILVVDGFGSTNIYCKYYEIILIAAPVVQFSVILFVAWMRLTGRMPDDIQCATASLLGFIITGKVFSTQYMIWLTPFVAALNGRTGERTRPIFFLCCFLTRIIYPGPGFGGLGHNRLWAVVLLNARNLILLYIFIILIIGDNTNKKK